MTSAFTGSRDPKGVSSKPMKGRHNLVPLPRDLASSSSSKVSDKSIKFYNRGEPYYEFTNFYPAPLTIDGQRWPSTEHYFQAQKFIGTPYLEMIRGFSSAREAFQLSRNPTVSQWRRSDWDAVKDDIMFKALRCKFAQHSDLMKKLWETGDRELVEHTANDSYWADGGGHGKGLNKLGKLLMKVRDDIIEVCGTYHKPDKECSDSIFASGGARLKRSSSFSDLTGYTAKKSNSVTVLDSNDALSSRLQGTTLGGTRKTPRSRLRRSSSLSRVPNSGDYNKTLATTSSATTHKGTVSSATARHPSAQTYVQPTLHRYLKMSETSATQGKGATPQRFYSSSSHDISSGPTYRKESRNPITGETWY